MRHCVHAVRSAQAHLSAPWSSRKLRAESFTLTAGAPQRHSSSEIRRLRQANRLRTRPRVAHAPGRPGSVLLACAVCQRKDADCEPSSNVWWLSTTHQLGNTPSAPGTPLLACPRAAPAPGGLIHPRWRTDIKENDIGHNQQRSACADRRSGRRRRRRRPWTSSWPSAEQ